MNKSIFLILFTLISMAAYSQEGYKKDAAPSIKRKVHSDFLRQTRAETMANTLAINLGLDTTKTKQLLQVNLIIENEKANAWKTITNRVEISKKLQEIENRRNELYRKVLSANEYDQYLNSRKQKDSK